MSGCGRNGTGAQAWQRGDTAEEGRARAELGRSGREVKVSGRVTPSPFPSPISLQTLLRGKAAKIHPNPPLLVPTH